MKPQDNQGFYKFYNTSKEKLSAYNLSISKLSEIYDDHRQQTQSLEQTAVLLASEVQKMPGVHSVRWRIKDASHLISKIIRKHEDRNEKYKGIDAGNYKAVIQDLVGLRALHLYKSSMLSIDEEIKKALNISEGPTAYIRQGDSVSAIEERGFIVKEHADAYRSVHYIVKCKPFKEEIFAELQVRTIFEEGWAEIDHDIRYPDYNDNALVRQFLGIFNRLCGGADEMGDFVKTLTLALTAESPKTIASSESTRAQFEAMKLTISKLSSMFGSKEQLDIINDLARQANELESNYTEITALAQSAVEKSYHGLQGWGLAARFFSDIITASAAAQRVKNSEVTTVDMGKAITIESSQAKED